ncbi:hypothetical protein ABPG72_000782 [Tetrahymena utriculariae]
MKQDKIVLNLDLTQIAEKEEDLFLINLQYDNLFNRILFQFIDDKKVYVWDIQSQLLEGIIGIPDSYDTKIKLTSKYIVTSSSFQLNFYSRARPILFQIAVSRQNFASHIISYFIIQDQFVILLHSDRLEVLVIQNNHNFIIDARQYNYPKIMKIINIDQSIYLYGLHQSGVFEIKYNTLLYQYNYNKQSSYYGRNTITQCYLALQNTSNFQQTLSQIYQILPITSQSVEQNGRKAIDNHSTNIFLFINVSSWQISQFIKQISLSNQISKILLSKSKFDQSDLTFQQSLNFPLKKKDFQIQGFNIQIEPINPKEPINITFDERIQNSILDSISIINQDISNTQITFSNQQKIVLSNILIRNCTAKNALNGEIQAFFKFHNVSSLVIYNFVITDNYFSSQNDLKYLFYINNVVQIIINNIQIKNNFQNQNYSIFSLLLIQVLQINSINVFNNTSILEMNNQNSKQYQNMSDQQSPIINIISSNYTIIIDSTFVSNVGVPLLKNTNYILDNSFMLTLLNDLFTIQSCQFYDNIFDQSFSFIQLESSKVKFEFLSWQRNTGNIFIQKSQIINISNSVFKQNIAIDGGALYLYNIQNFTSFENSTFTQNRAEGSGGSIYIFNQNYQCMLQFDQLTKIFENSARIGGGIRILNKQITNQPSQNELFKSNIYQNRAEIYGNDLATYIQEIKIDKYIFENSQQSSQNYTFKINSNLNQSSINYKGGVYSQQINIINFTSGGKIQMQVFFLDSYKRKITFNKSYLQLAKYPKLINEELMSMQVSVESLSNSAVQLTGDKQINYILYDEQTSSFMLTDLTISAQISSSFYFSINTFLENIYSNQFPILMLIEFRPCFVGEVIQPITDKIQICKYCSAGTYSLQDPLMLAQSSQDSTSYLINQCKLCPTSAVYCEGNMIQLKNGFWRQNQTTDEIVQCSQVNNKCRAEDSKSSYEGCVEGYVGPICGQCDLTGKVWNTTGLMYSPQIEKGICYPCSEPVFQFLILGFNIFCLFCYFLFCEKTFMSNNLYSSTCYYLRQLNFLPVLKNSFRDLSGYYIKIVITFLQLSSILTSSQEVFSIKLDFPFIYIGSSSYNISVGLSCILGQEIFRKYGKIKVVLLVYSLIPITFLFTIQLLLAMQRVGTNVQPNSKRMLYYRALTYLHLLYFFFLTDSIQFFSSALNCVQIGSESYQSIDTTVLCSDLNYKSHIYFVSYLQLSLFSLIPLIILFQIRRHKKTLNYCIIKYVYGYYYNEFQMKYYYWEILRIYVKILVIYTNSLLGYYDKDIANNIIIAFMAFYLKILNKSKPYITRDLNQKEIQCYMLLILKIILFNFYYKSYTAQIVVQSIMYLIDYIFFFQILGILLIQYSNNFNSRFSKILRYLIQKLLPVKISKKILNLRQVSFKTFQRWKLIKKNLGKIIKCKAQSNMKSLKRKRENMPKKSKVSFNSNNPLMRLSAKIPKSPLLKSQFYQSMLSEQKCYELSQIGYSNQYDSPVL